MNRRNACVKKKPHGKSGRSACRTKSGGNGGHAH